ncbi:MAG: hypothetical protein Q4C31_06550 [Eubacteriales bacterium]|nr:hypothetical protein [Eubacteriales bacterium]
MKAQVEAYLARQRQETDAMREKSVRRQWRRRQDDVCAALGLEAEAAETLTEEECAAVEEALAEQRALKQAGRHAGRNATGWMTAAMMFCALAGLAAAGIAFHERRSLSLILGILAGTAFGAAALYGLREILRIAREIYGNWQKDSLEKK